MLLFTETKEDDNEIFQIKEWYLKLSWWRCLCVECLFSFRWLVIWAEVLLPFSRRELANVTISFRNGQTLRNCWVPVETTVTEEISKTLRASLLTIFFPFYMLLEIKSVGVFRRKWEKHSASKLCPYKNLCSKCRQGGKTHSTKTSTCHRWKQPFYFSIWFTAEMKNRLSESLQTVVLHWHLNWTRNSEQEAISN